VQIHLEVIDEIYPITQTISKKRRLKSVEWQHFEKMKVDGKYKVKCKHRKKLLK